MSKSTAAGRARALRRIADAQASGGYLTRDRDGGNSRDALLTRRDGILARLAADDLTDEESTALVAEAEEVRAAIETWNTREAARTALLGADPAQTAQRSGTAATVSGGGAVGQSRATATDREQDPQVAQRLGEQVTRSEQFAAFRSRGYSGTAAIDLPGNVRALITTGDVGFGANGVPTRAPERILTNEDRALRLADLIDRRPVNSTSIEYVQENLVTDSAAEVAEGAAKPESTWTMSEQTAPVRTIAHFTNITRQAAEDDAQMVAYVEGRLSFGLERRLDAQILSGNGTAPNLRGILNTSGIGTYVAPASEAAVLSIRKAMTIGQVSEFPPDTVVLHPVDWERVELSTDSQGMFRVSASVANSLAPRIWGLNVVASTVITGTTGGGTPVGGRFLVGSFRMGATLWERDGVRILMTDSHASNFTSNILTLLAEMRAALSVWRPKAFVAGTFATGTQ